MRSVGEKRAVIDVGSNSLLLVVAEWDGQKWNDLLETSEVTGLGTGTRETGLLSEQGIQTCLAALRRAWDAAKDFKVVPKTAATMAVRIAKNAHVLIDRAQQQGTPVSVLSGDEEARLGMKCVYTDPLFASEPRLTVIDVGGHSTEIITTVADGDHNRTVFRRSFPVGTLSLNSLSPECERASGPDLLRASAEIDDVFGMRYLKGQAGLTVALGASATNLVSIRDEVVPWIPSRVHGAYLDFEEISKFAGMLGRLSIAERAELTGIEPGREHTIHIGALILERALQCVHGLGARVSTKGWRHALLGED
jgi:exopolyphosphatase/guanosine-5'-triphosphate,3'-diphosphate pyrophosphatase